MLKMTGLKVKTKSDIVICLYIEKGLGRGISYIGKGHSKANNKHMKNYKPSKPSIHIQYLDMNNLYGCE